LKTHRVILNTDAKNEADDQYAIVHALLTPSFEVHGIIAAHFGRQGSMLASLAEVNLLLKLMNLTVKIRVEPGALEAMPDEKTPRPSPGAQFIIDEAMKDDSRALNIVFQGPLTDMASALLMEPAIEKRNIHVVWIGGADGLTHYGKEFNLNNDVHSANVVMRSKLKVTQIPYPVYSRFCVSHAELMERVYPHGAIGRYLVEQLIEFNAGNQEFRSLGDSPGIGVLLAWHAGASKMQPALEYDPVTCAPRPNPNNRPIRVYESFDSRFLLEDFYAKLAQFARKT
jgi:inosine-uridine nucleoside N-ribohydrolase